MIRALLGLGAAMVLTLCFGRGVLNVLAWPYVRVMEHLGRPTTLRVLGPGEGMAIYLRVALVGGLVLASPWIAWQVWQFLAAGLEPRERRFVTRAVPFSAGLFIAGSLFYLLVVAEPMMLFFVAFNDWLGLANDFTFINTIGMMLNMLLVFGLSFQLPVVVAILGWVGLVSGDRLAGYRRHVVVGLLIFAAMMTSPSPLDQVLLAVPMWLLYELGVLLVRLQERKRSARMVGGQASLPSSSEDPFDSSGPSSSS